MNFSALRPTANLLISLQLIAQILLIAPFLIAMSIKVKNYKDDGNMSSLVKLASLSSMNYIIALWITYSLKWSEMASADLSLFSFSPRIVGLANTAITLSLSVVFAVIGFVNVMRNKNGRTTPKLWGFAAIFLSLHFIIYVVYCASVGVPYFVQLSELWLIPLLGVGIYLLLKKPTVIGVEETTKNRSYTQIE